MSNVIHNSSGPQRNARKARRLGPGTLAMLAFLAVLAVVGFEQTQQSATPVSQIPAPTHPLAKPEPSSLLSQPNLNLSRRQRSAIQSFSLSWSSDRAKLLTAMSEYVPKRGTADQISGSLESYSELSRDYDVTRSKYWSMAYGLLDEKQKARVEGGSK